MNKRRKRKAWKKMIAEIKGIPSGFGQLTPCERKEALKYLRFIIKKGISLTFEAAIDILEQITRWAEDIQELEKARRGGSNDA